MKKTTKKALILGALSGALLYIAKKTKDEGTISFDKSEENADGFITVPQAQD
ncbi:hypothetical protein SAMN02745196_01960 [Clostridium collagenovorans DSM 3089]|uniref:Uncharacterized protein n=1 Tax=Clostridium collagenovorans DSM 3089 TaxID=1121306 RepID=A0A1M5WYC1_9CLOT|nr:hypothetical protein [Clostridium collagenovorans]SHH92609.1 hypothetical protein SAMN02745196_01960 [Clostridium collagenovorans DSM 3089]